MFRSFFSKIKRNLRKEALKDPVCGMRATDVIASEYQGVTYTFCSDHCRQVFQASPESYI